MQSFFGATGSGKTYLTKLTVGRVANHLAMESTCICDFKGDDDFSFLEGKYLHERGLEGIGKHAMMKKE